MQKDIIARMNNLADSGQDAFTEDYAELARVMLYELGISNTYLNSGQASYILGKVVTDILDTGELSKTAEKIIATLRVNHPHSEDIVNV